MIVTGNKLEEHNKHVLALFKRIDELGLCVKLEKCFFLKRVVKFLGNVINENGHKPDQVKIEARTLHIIRYAYDICQYGIGGVMLHQFEDGNEKAIACAGRALTESKNNWRNRFIFEVYGKSQFAF